MSAKTPLYVVDLDCGHRRYIRAASPNAHLNAVAPVGRASCSACNGQVDVVHIRQAVIGVDVHARACVDDEGRTHDCGCGLEEHLADLHEVERAALERAGIQEGADG